MEEKTLEIKVATLQKIVPTTRNAKRKNMKIAHNFMIYLMK